MKSINFTSGVKIIYYGNILKKYTSAFDVDNIKLPLIRIKQPYNIIKSSKWRTNTNDVLNFFKIDKYHDVY